MDWKTKRYPENDLIIVPEIAFLHYRDLDLGLESARENRGVLKAGYQLEDVFVATFKPKPLGFYLYVKFLGDNIILTGSPKFNLVPIINGRVFQVEPTHPGYIGADGSFYMLNAADGMIKPH